MHLSEKGETHQSGAPLTGAELSADQGLVRRCILQRMKRYSRFSLFSLLHLFANVAHGVITSVKAIFK